MYGSELGFPVLGWVRLLNPSLEQCLRLGFQGDNIKCRVSWELWLSNSISETRWSSCVRANFFLGMCPFPFLMEGQVISRVSSPWGDVWPFGALFHVPSSFELRCFLHFAPNLKVQKDVALRPTTFRLYSKGCDSSFLNTYLFSSSSLFCFCPKLVWLCERGFQKGRRTTLCKGSLRLNFYSSLHISTTSKGMSHFSYLQFISFAKYRSV